MKKILTIFILTFLTCQLSASMIICNINLSQEINCYWSAGDCSTKAPGIDYCFNVDPWTGALSQGRAQVFIDEESNGAVQIGNKIVNILPDFLDSLIRTNKLNEINNVQPTKISTKVSKKRFEEIAKELGVKVTKVKTLPNANYCPACEEEEKKKKAQDKATINPFESVIIEMVCDCNPSQVLNTFVTDANGVVNITVPKDANYSFKLVMPPVLKEKGIKIADLASDVVVNFTGAKNVENFSFNNKGVAAAKNLQQGNYEIALSRKPPKGGPKGPPPSRKCPPGEIPWCGGCIPADVVNKVQQDNWAICCRQGNKACCDMAPKPSIEEASLAKGEKTAVDINCPSGKYDANGNCIFVSQATVNVAQKTKIKIGGNVGYHIGSSAVKNSTSPLLFFKSGQSAGLDFMLFPKQGTTRYKLAVDFVTGTNDKNAVTAYAKEKDIVYTSYKFTKAKPRGFSIMASPQFMLFPKSQNKKLPLMWLDLQVGALINNQQSIQFFTTQTTPSKEIKNNAVSFVYRPSLVVNIVKTKKFFINLKAGYSNFGGFGIGVGITERDCRGAQCFKCNQPGCCPDWCPKSEASTPLLN